jgi:transcriptional regulator with XRE-family HTH domain
MSGSPRTSQPNRPPTQLRVLRLQLGLTQAALAARLGLSEPTVRRWERSGTAGRHDTAIRLALAGLRALLWREHLSHISWLVRRAAEERSGQRWPNQHSKP